MDDQTIHEEYLVTDLSIRWLSSRIDIQKISVLAGQYVSLLHKHNVDEFICVAEGSGRIHLSDEREHHSFPLEKGGLFYVRAQVQHYLESSPDHPVKIVLLSCSFSPCENLRSVPEQWILDERTMLQSLFSHNFLFAGDAFGCDGAWAEVLRALRSSSRGGYIQVANLISGFLLKMVLSLTNSHEQVSYLAPPDESPGMNGVRMINDYVRMHFTEDISLAGMAEALHYSPRQCQRFLTENMGISFSELLNDLRLGRAKTLLDSTDYPLNIIAETSGFPNAKAFSSRFSRKFGVSPLQYRKAVRAGEP